MLIFLAVLVVLCLSVSCMVHSAMKREGKDRLRFYYMLHPRKTWADKARKMIIYFYFKSRGWSLNVFSAEGS